MTENSLPMHPGEFLWSKFLHPLDIDLFDLAHALPYNSEYLLNVLEEDYSMTEELAEKLEQYFPPSKEFWMAMQYTYDHGHSL